MSDRSESIGSDRGPGIISTGGGTARVNEQEGTGNQEVGSTTGGVIGPTLNPTISQVENFVGEMGEFQRAQGHVNVGTGENVDVGGAGTSGLGGANTRRPRAEYSVTQMADLIAQFQQGLHFYHYTWLEPMRDISIKCWDLARGNLENVAMINYAGFLILPGLISVMRKIKGGQKIVDFLISTSKSSAPGMTVVKKARLVLSELEADRRRRQGREFRSPTVDSLSKQVDKYIDEDRLSAAVGVVSRIHDLMENVEESHVPLTPEQIREKIASLHPAQDEYDILPPDKSSDPDGIQVNEENVWVWVRRLNIKSGTGISGWTNRLIRAMMTRATGDRGVAQDKLCAARTAFANLMNAVLNGSISKGVAALMALTRTVLIPKDGGGWRPLGIGEGWYRLLWKVVVGKVGAELGRNLMPHQLAVGVKGGCEIGARLAQVAYDVDLDMVEDGEEMCLIQLDLENAFNMQGRRQIYDSLVERCPGLVRIFRALYGFKSKLYLGSGECVGESGKGVRQGCPGAMLLFGCGGQNTLLALHQAAMEVKEEVGSSLPAGASGLADDTTLFIGEKGANTLIARAEEIFERNRVRLRGSKCKILVHPGRKEKLVRRDESGNAIPPRFGVVDTGIRVLGTPVGTEEYRRGMLATAFEAMVKPLPALTRVNPQSAFTLLQLCYNARPCYLTRVSEPHLYRPFAHSFDTALDTALAAIARTDLTPEICALRSLPQSLGGLSLPRHGGPQSEKGCLASRELTKAYIMAHRPELARGMEKWRNVEVGDGSEMRYRAEIAIEDPENFPDLDHSLPNDILLLIADHKFTWGTVYTSLIRAGRHHHAAWLLSGSSIGTAKWLTWQGGLEGRFRFGREEFIEALRLRLLVDPFTAPLAALCTHCTDVHYRTAPLHALECPRLQPARRWRHDRVRDHLRKALENAFPRATVRAEHTINGNIQGTTLRADIHMALGAQVFVFDVAVVDPAAPSYLAMESHKNEDVAARHREAAKREGWDAIGGVDGATFIPFVVEATGRMGPCAREYFDTKLVSDDGPHVAKIFLQKMSYAIARWNARMVRMARGQVPVGHPSSSGAGGGGGA